VWLLIAYTVIIGGGLLITRRLRLLGLAAAFWLTLMAGVGILAGSGHCMTANWAFAPVCGFDFWRVIVTSPEVLIFLFFMITDPKTTPEGRVGRVAFGILVGIASTLLMAPQTDEWWTKVGLLSGLVVICAARPLLDRMVPAPRSAADDLGDFAGRVVTGGQVTRRPARTVLGVSVVVVAFLAVSAGIVVAGTPARAPVPATAEVLDRVPHQVDPATFPSITVEQDVADWNHEIAGPGGQELMLHLAENLELENEAMVRRDPTILAAVDHGDRLVEMQERLAAATAAGQAVIRHYRFDAVDVTLIEPFGVQSGLSLGVRGRGTLTEETVDASGAVTDRTSEPFERTFILRRALGDRWMNVAVDPPGS
jgi:hypothetical protein